MGAINRGLKRLERGKPPLGRPKFGKATRFRISRAGKWLQRRRKLAEDCSFALALLKAHRGNLARGQRRRKSGAPTLRRRVKNARWMGGYYGTLLGIFTGFFSGAALSSTNTGMTGYLVGAGAAGVLASPLLRSRETKALMDIHKFLRQGRLHTSIYGEKLTPDQILHNRNTIRELGKKIIALKRLNAEEIARLQDYVDTARTTSQIGVKA